MKKSSSNDQILAGQQQNRGESHRQGQGARRSVDIDQLTRNDNVEAFYCNTVSPVTENYPPHSTALGAEEEESFYVNVKH